MLFNSLEYAVFLPTVFLLYWILPHKYRWIVLLVASYYFYMCWNVEYVFLILFTTVVSYVAAIFMEKANGKKERKTLLLFTAAASLWILFIFKYLNFVLESIRGMSGLLGINVSLWTVQILLPVGISFYTFQTLSYVIDVYRGKIKAERHFGYYASFISFFPQLVAGPIERTENLLPQIKEEHCFDSEKMKYGLKLMAFGFFKKLVIADGVSVYVDRIYNDLGSYQGFSLIAATVFFAIQIYCDFSGYSDIAIGTAELFGIRLMKNFDSPYFSCSIKEFWSRWHISLSSWFRDYVYIPLGGNRCGKLRHSFNLLVTFLVSGLWHGANWTFLAWGGVHGIAQIVENIFSRKNKRNGEKAVIWKLFHMLLTFCFCCFAWIFFRSQSIQEAVYVIRHSLSGISEPIQYLKNAYHDIGITKLEFAELCSSFAILAVYDYFSLKWDVIARVSRCPAWIRWGFYYILIFFLLFVSNFTSSEFVYFQF